MSNWIYQEAQQLGGASQATMPRSENCPPGFLEYMWYVSLVYAMLGKVWGVVIPAVGGAFLVALAAASLLSVRGAIWNVYTPVAWAISTGILVVTVQFIFHSDRSLEGSIIMTGWLSTVVIVQALSQRRGFLYRFAWVAFAIGVATLPYLSVRSEMGGGPTRLGASGTGIANPNSLAMWFGFCTVFFIFWGMQARTVNRRLVFWGGAIFSLLVIMLTVSRGAILALALACAVGFRSVLKRNFAPVVFFFLLVVLLYGSGVFQDLIEPYLQRGMEESGRGKVWPLVLERISDSPWVGVGLENIYTLTSRKHGHNPHNGLLFLALSSGIGALICFLGYLMKVGMGAFRIMKMDSVGEAMVIPPLVTFGVLQIMTSDTFFMAAWVVVVFALAAAFQSPTQQH